MVPALDHFQYFIRARAGFVQLKGHLCGHEGVLTTRDEHDRSPKFRHTLKVVPVHREHQSFDQGQLLKEVKQLICHIADARKSVLDYDALKDGPTSIFLV